MAQTLCETEIFFKQLIIHLTQYTKFFHLSLRINVLKKRKFNIFQFSVLETKKSSETI